MKQDFIENNIIIFSKQTIDLFLEQPHPANLIALYCFYYYTAKWQKTNQPKATVAYVAQGLRWGKDKVRSNKQRLIKLGLIEDARHTDKATGKVKGWYVKIKYLWKRENHPTDLPEGGLYHSVVYRGTNAYSVNKVNALSVNSKNSNASVAGKEINDLIELFKEVNPSYKILFGNRTQYAALIRMIKEHGEEKLRDMIVALPQVNKIKYMPITTTPYELEKNMGKIKARVEQQRSDKVAIIR